MIQINLIPDVKREYLKTRELRNAVISLSIVIGVGVIGLGVVLGLIFSGQLITESIQDGNIKKEGQSLTSIEDLNKTVTIQQQLERIDSQHSTKAIDSRLFDVLVAINPPAPNEVKISTFKLNPEEKTISIEGSAANGYIALEVLKKTITNTSVQTQVEGEEVKVPLAQDIVSGDTSFGEDTTGQRVLRFSFTFTYPDELFAVSKTPVTIITPVGRVDVTDSRLGVPESLFGQKAKDATTGEGN